MKFVAHGFTNTPDRNDHSLYNVIVIHDVKQAGIGKKVFSISMQGNSIKVSILISNGKVKFLFMNRLS